MKNLVLSTLFAAVASQAAGCIIVSDDAPVGLGEIDFAWALKSTNMAGDTIPAGCPVGATGATLFALPQGAAPASAFQDQYDCIDGGGLMQDLEPGTYTVWVRLHDASGATRFAESASQIVQVGDGTSTPVDFDIYVDRAFFLVGWNLVAPGGASPTCAQVQGEDGVAITATDGGGGLFDVTVDCEEGDDRQTVSEPLPSDLRGGARYTVVLSLLNAQQQSIGDSDEILNKSLDYGNELEDLGIVPIDLR